MDPPPAKRRSMVPARSRPVRRLQPVPPGTTSRPKDWALLQGSGWKATVPERHHPQAAPASDRVWRATPAMSRPCRPCPQAVRGPISPPRSPAPAALAAEEPASDPTPIGRAEAAQRVPSAVEAFPAWESEPDRVGVEKGGDRGTEAAPAGPKGSARQATGELVERLGSGPSRMGSAR